MAKTRRIRYNNPGGLSGLSMLGNEPLRQPLNTRGEPARYAYCESALWRVEFVKIERAQGTGPINCPNAMGLRPTGIVSVTRWVAVSITDTVLSSRLAT
ncbi:MAG: hypothetical protein ETSY2_21925 [Candidatus Entotheonella gemina]|uniref:Uncharacterized protein n=1 Tax=Candidatus Entotheonella gemina TaxID=1429439 RepID=W4M606_9BACT|nr:MAG: hypothetical protein ETSY2_21925 [Candidatus Entotheonella gemina]